MKRTMLKSKIHNIEVTETNLEYEGSLTLDESLMQEADMVPFEQINVYNITNGERFATYLIKGKKDSGVVGVNGAAAHKVKKGDRLILATYAQMEDKDIDFFRPRILVCGPGNKIKSSG
ncbi:MAG: aspartate 1-decarboxylase [Candidatus Aminicenantes bacterium]|nr:aspartate 1-decarboxylase [Candidatus Aminicenantes bacterium]